MNKINYYSLEKIKKCDCQYNMIIGERSNGKTYAILMEVLKNYAKGKESALIRRFDMEIKPNLIGTIFSHIIANGEMKKIFGKNSWSGVIYRSRRFYLTKHEISTNKNGDDVDTLIIDDNPFMYTFALNLEENYKETAYPNVTLIFFDEFISRRGFLDEEFILFQNIISTIKRKRQDVRIYMCGNSIDKYCVYFKEMGLNHVAKMKPGDLEIYSYPSTSLKVAVEFTGNASKVKGKKDIDPYFAFDNPKLKMITTGEWEIDIYPHCPCKILPKNIYFSYFVKYEEQIMQCDICMVDNNWFTYVHRKSTPIRHPDKDCIYQQEYDYRKNYHMRLTQPKTILETRIASFYNHDKVFYQDNELGELMRHYLAWSSGNDII